MQLIYTTPSKTLQPGCRPYPKELAVPEGSEYLVPEAPLEAKKKKKTKSPRMAGSALRRYGKQRLPFQIPEQLTNWHLSLTDSRD